MENQRIRVTKRMLKDALIRLLRQKQIEKIKVQELCTEAQINRTTFYKYYGNQYDLLNEIQSDFLQQVERHFSEGGEPANLVKVLAYMDEQRELCLALIQAISDDSLLKSLIALSSISAELEQGIAVESDESRRIYMTEFILRGAYSVVLRWLYSEKPEPPEFIADVISSLARKICG